MCQKSIINLKNKILRLPNAFETVAYEIFESFKLVSLFVFPIQDEIHQIAMVHLELTINVQAR